MRNYRRWTDEENEYLKEWWGILPAGKLAHNLKRSLGSVWNHAHQMGLGRWFDNTEDIPVRLLIGLMYGEPYPNKKIDTWLKHGLRVTKVNASMTGAHNKTRILINIDRFWRWAEKHQKLIDLYKLERGALGNEPEWTKLKRASDSAKHEASGKRWRRWSKAENERLRYLAESGRYTVDEIARELRRSLWSVRQRLCARGLRVKKRAEAVRLTDSEKAEIVRMAKAGYNMELIAKKTGITLQRVKTFLDYELGTTDEIKIRKLA